MGLKACVSTFRSSPFNGQYRVKVSHFKYMFLEALRDSFYGPPLLFWLFQQFHT